MRFAIPVLAVSTAMLTSTVAAQEALSPGIWTNTEDEYFAEEEGRAVPEWTAFEVADDGRWRTIDPYGRAQEDWRDDTIPGLALSEEGAWQINGSELRLSRPFDCWISVRKFGDKPDGSADWSFANNLRTFDQGGRILVEGNGEAPDVTFRLRNVTWARGSSNRPSLVLYAHRDDPELAESYAWTSPDADLIGINLRWVQGSCAPTAINEGG